jgi:hypothetical protein
MFLKRAIKYNIKLGDFKWALIFGEEILKEKEKDYSKKDILNQHLHRERIIYNLALVALKVKDYNNGMKYCQIIFDNKEQSNNNKDSSQKQNKLKKWKTEYINWQRGKENDYPGKNLPIDKDYDNKLRDEEFRVKLKLYMKMIIRSLDQKEQDKNQEKNDKKAFLQAIIRFYDSAEERKALKDTTIDLNEIRSTLQGNGNLKEYFKSKIINALKIKNKAEDNNAEKTQIKEKEQQNLDYEIFKKLFKYFAKDKVFYSFEKEDKEESKSGNPENTKEDEKDGKFMKDDSKNEIDDDDPGESSQDEQQSNDSTKGDNKAGNGF